MYAKTVQSLPDKWEPTGIPELDEAGIKSVEICRRTYDMLQAYIIVTENRRYLIGLKNDAENIMQNEHTDAFSATKAVLKRVAEEDKNRPEGEEPVLPKVSAALENRWALDHVRMLTELQSLRQQWNQLQTLNKSALDAAQRYREQRLRELLSHVEAREQFRGNFELYRADSESTRKFVQYQMAAGEMILYLFMQYSRDGEMAEYTVDGKSGNNALTVSDDALLNFFKDMDVKMLMMPDAG